MGKRYTTSSNVSRRVGATTILVMGAAILLACNERPSSLSEDSIASNLSRKAPPDPSLVMGFEHARFWWATSGRTATSGLHVEGLHSLAVGGGGWRELWSVPIAKPASVSATVAYDLRLPFLQSNRWWYGQTQLFIDAASAGIHHEAVGAKELTGLPLGRFVTIEHQLPQWIFDQLSGREVTDLRFIIALNVPWDAKGIYHFDHLRFVGATDPCAGVDPDDGNPCTTDVCDPTTGIVTHDPVADGTGCPDDDLCNGDETCLGGDCVFGIAPTVDDDNPCTDDSCDPASGVANVPVADGTACSDADLCNGDETCTAGDCMPGTPLIVDDANPCTADACDPLTGVANVPVADGTACSDADLCNGDETCSAGNCMPGTPLIVDDGNPCTADTCDPMSGIANVAVADGTACPDADLCNGDETCTAGDCTPGVALVVDDGNPCTADACDPATGVANVPLADGTACADADVCNGGETCSAGTCTPGVPLLVDDGNPCTADACDPVTGVTHLPVADGAACADADACNGDEICAAGNCMPGLPPAVDDGNPCTADACDPVTGVTHLPVADGTDCADTDVCNGAETCVDGSCVPGAPLVVDDGNPCTADACDPVTGVANFPVADGTACADADVCNGSETCSAGACTPGLPLLVDDGNPCTADACDPVTGVTHLPVADGTACADTDVCNGAETCVDGSCVPGAPLVVDDGNPCTADACDPVTGIANVPVADGTACADADVCNGAETCAGGSCVPGTPLVVDDGNPCTADTCDPVAGVANPPVPNGTDCTDADACNGVETCQEGACTAGTPPVIDDSNPCTTDSCDPASGPVHVALPNGTSCSDGDMCNGVETCLAGACTAGDPLEIEDDGNPCTTDGCDPGTGATLHVPAPVGTTCPDEDICNGTETCDSEAVCVPGATLDVDDGDPSTIDTCDPVVGPVHRAAPLLDPTIPTTVFAAGEWLYTGDDPIQTGVLAGTIELHLAAIVHGRVLNASGNPLPNVAVRVRDRDEFGTTITHADGRFEMAVNGGERLTFSFTREGYLETQRALDLPVNDEPVLEDLVLLERAQTVTLVDLASTEPVQIVRGGEVADADGAREAILLVPSGTTATLRHADGTTEDLATLHLRLTESTVGEWGPAAVPAELPATTAYAYVLEIDADEAVATGATEVILSQPLPLYVDNFLDFPVGTTIPTGMYDRERGAWMPDASGFVVAIVDVTNGVAELDTDGDGAAEPASELEAMGITLDERTALASLFANDLELWRVAPARLAGPTALNWARDLPTSPDPIPVAANSDEGYPIECGEPGASMIECQNRVHTESVPIAGTPLSLTYRSDRVGDATALTHLDIPLTGNTVSPGVEEIQVAVRVAGRAFRYEVTPAPNLTLPFQWDGLDEHGRLRQGTLPVTVTVTHLYAASYFSVNAFGKYSSNGTETGVESRTPAVVQRRYVRHFTRWDAPEHGLGGWSLDAHHIYSPAVGRLYPGDGPARSSRAIGGVAELFAGGGTSTAEGAPALETRISSQAATLAVGPDGSVYFTDNRTTSIPTNTIRRVDPNGLVFRVAGNTTAGYSGDGGLATEAQLSNVTDVAVAPDGSVYIADTDNNRVRRVDPNGIITTFAGTGVLAESNSSLPDAGVPATSAPLRQPRAVAVGPDGSVFIGHSRWTRYSVLRVDPSGVAYTVVGGGPNHACLLDVPGPQATTQPYDLMVGPDGTLYIADQECAQNILKVGVDGVLHAVPGIGSPWLAVDVSTAIHPFGVAVDANGTVYAGARGNNSHVWALFPNSEVPRLLVGASTGSPFVSGGPATGMIVVSDVESAGSPVALAPDGSLYTADNSRIYRIHRGTPDLRHGESIIPSLDGSEAYRFDPQGRHLETVDTHTGATRLAFEYDPLHFVSSVTDADGNVTAIERDSAGVPLRIIAPHGQVTTLSVNPLGQLETIAGPEGQIWQLSYDPGALLATVTDPRSYPSHLTYNSLGQLVRHEDSAGGYQELATPDPLVPTTVSRTTASGIVTTFRTEHRADGGYELRSALPDGTEATVVATPDGVTVATLADGTITTRKETPDPVWGMLAPQGTTTTALPSGLTRTLITSRTATTDPSDPTVLLTERVVSATGGYVAQVDYDGTTRTFTTTDPVNRTATRVIDPLGHTIATAMPGINGTTFLHDTEGRLSTVTQGSRLTQRDYFVTADGANGYLATLTNAASVTTTYTPDALGRVLVESVAGIATGFAWDARNNLVGLTPPSRPSHIQTFTPVNLLDTYTPPAAGVPDPATDYEYDLDRHLVLTTKPGGVVVDRDYDFAGRLDLLTMPTGTIDYAYYPVDCTGSCAPGRLAAIAGPSSIALSLGYDGSLPTGITWTGEVNGSVAWSYDNAFRRTVESVSNGATTASVAFSYANDGLVRCASLSTCSGSEADALHLVYSALTPRLASTRLGLVTDELTYNPYGELATYTARFDTADLYRVVYDSATTPRDGLGRVVEKTETLQGAERSSRYGYDDVGRLIAVTEDGLLTEEYQYDDNGNRRFLMTTEGTTEGTYDEQDRMVAYGDFVYTYTPDGALASKTDTATNDVTTYQYDALGSLLRVDLPDSTVIEYVVDGRGRRMAKRVDGVTVRRWLYRDHLSPVAELDGDGQLTWQYVYGPKSGVPAFAVRVEDGALYRVVSDQLGSVVLVVNAANAADVLLSARYSAFGEQSVVLGDPEALPFGFAGGRYDPDTGLVRFGARDYDPTTGRWTSREPKLRSDSPNQYLYGRGNPVDLRDPTGHEPREVAHAAIPEAPPSGQTLTDL